jgi:KEOPS complex subunit Cgi121
MARTSVIKGTRWAVSIGGFKDVSVGDVNSFLDHLDKIVSPFFFQVFDACMVGGYGHLFYAVVNAVKAHEAGIAISRNLEIEVLLYASCQDQISKAFSIMGVKPESEKIALVVLADRIEKAKDAFDRASIFIGVEDDSVLDVDEKKLRELISAFSVSERALKAVGGPREEALTMLLIERGALLTLRR